MTFHPGSELGLFKNNLTKISSDMDERESP